MSNIKLMNVSDFLDEKVSSFLLGAFMSRYVYSENGEYISTVCSFKKSIKVHVPNFDFNKYIDTYKMVLNEESAPYKNWGTKDEFKENYPEIDLPVGKLFFLLKNDLHIPEKEFYNRLFAKFYTQYDELSDDSSELTEEKKKFIRGFMELRGSIDTNRAHISQDYFFHSKRELSKARLFVDALHIPCAVVNINFRELQEQYHTGVSLRNTQFRLNLFWYMSEVGILNEYKAKVFALSRGIEIKEKKGNVYYFSNEGIHFREMNSLLDERLNLYATKMFDKKLTDEDIKRIRETLAFDKESKNIRDSELVRLFRLTMPDECMACKEKYEICDRAEINKTTGRYDLDVHHVISIGKNKELDDWDNLVKLCPACHNALKKGRGIENKQKELIANIFRNAPNTLEFAKSFFNLENIDEVIQKTFDSLK